MNIFKQAFFGIVGMAMLVVGGFADADSVSNSTVGVGGYDLVSYHTQDQPVRGSGRLVATVDGVNYLFSSQENLDTFNADQDKYLPQYGGYCAFGASAGKKFLGDPNTWSVIDDKLYLNLDKKVQDIWLEDTASLIERADSKWDEIKNVPASEL